VLLDGPTRAVFARVDELQAVGLDVPQVSRLMHELKARNIPVQTGSLTPEEACEEITTVFGRKKDAESGDHRAVFTR
jgi:hypothetical protein